MIADYFVIHNDSSQVDHDTFLRMREDYMHLKQQHKDDTQKLVECAASLSLISAAAPVNSNLHSTVHTVKDVYCIADWLRSWQGRKRQQRKHCCVWIPLQREEQLPAFLMQTATR